MNTIKRLKTKIHNDPRGVFSRTFDHANLETFDFQVMQSNISKNPTFATLRGLHYQTSGPPEHKIITLLSGSIFIAIVDLRPESPTFLQKTEWNLSDPLQESIYVPSGHATGWISTSPDTSLQYLMSARYEECTYSGVRFDDKALAINWPIDPSLMSDQDRSWPELHMTHDQP